MAFERNYIVFDTNALVSVILRDKGLPAHAFKLAYEHFIFAASLETIGELVEVMKRDKFDKYHPPAFRAEFVAAFLQMVEVVKPTEHVTDCQDPKDNKFLDVAIAVNARAIVTGDVKHLISMNPYRTIPIISIREFVDGCTTYLQ